MPAPAPRLSPKPGIYGFPQPLYQHEADMAAFRFGFRSDRPAGGKGRYEHLIAYLSAVWPVEVCAPERLTCEGCRTAGRMLHTPRWNPWTERTLKELCSDDTAVYRGNTRVKCTILTGCAAASKTFSCGMYAFAWWIVAPFESIVMFTSTTKDMIKRRIWPVIQHFHDTAIEPLTGQRKSGWGFCKKTESRTSIDYIAPGGSPSEKNSIFAMAVAHGETQKAAHNLRGLHDQRMLLIIDEMNGTPEAILDTIANQRKGCSNYELIGLGNPISHLDTHGQASRPVQGWSVVGEDAYAWKTAGVDKWEMEPGMCLRYDGKDSPNVKAGKDLWPFLYSTADWIRACDPKFEKTLAYWSQSRGLWPPDGQCRTIVSEAMLAKYDPEDGPPFRWLSRKRTIAFLDPAFGGDDCALYFAEVGDIGGEDGGQGHVLGAPQGVGPTPGAREAIQIIDTAVITFEHAAKDERDYIVARQTMEECKLRGIKPQDFGLDRTGTGRGVAAIISAEWSDAIYQIEFGSMATDTPSSTADGRPAREVYFNRVTEMWWSVREMLEAGQLRGLPTQARIELTTREYEWAGRRYKLESKEDFKLRFGFSPDDGDCASGICALARKSGVVVNSAASKRQDTAWNDLVAQQVRQAEEEYHERMDDPGASRGRRGHLSRIEMFAESSSDRMELWDD